MALLEVRNLKTYFDLGNGQIARAVDGVSFSLEAGRTLGIVGESGCGKSQTAFSIMRLVDQNCFHCEDSEILFNGENLLKKTDIEMQHIRGNDVAMIFQEPMSSLNPLYRIGNQLSEPLMLHQNMTKKEARKRCIELLEQVGIPDPESRVDNYPHEMSGGMKQRVMIAMALACKPKLLIADEPTTALDVTIQAQILSLMKELQQETGMAIVIITHDLGVVNQIADDVCVMYGGKVAEFGSRKEIFSNMQHPYTRMLLESIPSVNDMRYKLKTIKGIVPAATIVSKGCRFAERCQEVLDYCDYKPPKSYHCSKSKDSVHHTYCHLLDNTIKRERCGTQQDELRPKKNELKETLLTVSNLKTHFPVKRGLLMKTVNYVKAVDKFKIDIKKGETLALVGESGCGKTTAGQSILRLIKEAKGNVLFDGQNIFELSRKEMKSLRKQMQIIFQDPFSSLSPRKKVGDIVAEGLTIHEPDLTNDERNKQVVNILKTVGLDSTSIDRYPHEFSGGQRQRIAIARALILEPKFLVLDEPTSALDVSVQAQILNLLEQLQVERNLSYLFITHDLGVVKYIADNVAVMYLGEIVEYGATKEIFEVPRHPYTRALLDAVPKLGEQVEFKKITGDVPSPLNPPTGCHFHTRCYYSQDICKKIAPMLTTDDNMRQVSCHFPLS